MSNQIEEMVAKLNAAPPQPIAPEFQTVEAMFDDTAEFARKRLIGTKEDGDNPEFQPQWTLLTKSGNVAAVVTPFVGPDESHGKNLVAALIRKLIEEAGIIRYVFVSEAWLATCPVGEAFDDTPPSQRLDRKEVLLLTGGDREGGERTRIYDIVRDSDGVVVDLKFDKDLDKPDGQRGRFSGFMEAANY